MKKNTKKENLGSSINKLTLWIARSLSIITLFVVLLFMVGEGFNPFKFTMNELILSIFFPLMLLSGYILAFKKELWGGILSVAGLALFYIFHYVLQAQFPRGWAFLVFAFPGFLYLIYGIINHKAKK
ncbi:hypothetical protein MASR1M45_06490 [Candidatus Kapaibacterium sp.]